MNGREESFGVGVVEPCAFSEELEEKMDEDRACVLNLLRRRFRDVMSTE